MNLITDYLGRFCMSTIEQLVFLLNLQSLSSGKKSNEQLLACNCFQSSAGYACSGKFGG